MNLSGLGAVAGGYQQAQDQALQRQIALQRLAIEQQAQEQQQAQLQRQQMSDAALLQSYGGGGLPGAQPVGAPQMPPPPPQTGQQPMPGQPSVPSLFGPSTIGPGGGGYDPLSPAAGSPEQAALNAAANQPNSDGSMPPPMAPPPAPGGPPAAPGPQGTPMPAPMPGASPAPPGDPMAQFKQIGQQMANEIFQSVPASKNNPTLFAMLMNQKLEQLKTLQPVFKDQAEAVQNHIKNTLEQQRITETSRHDRVDEGQAGQRIGLEGQRLGVEQGRLTLDQKKLADAQGGIPTTPEDRKAIAAQVATGQPLNQIIPGYGKEAVRARAQAMSDARQEIKAQNPGMSDEEAGQELANRSIEFQSGKKSSGQLTQMLGATKQAVGQLDYNIDQVKGDLKKMGSSDLSPIINAIARGEEKWTGDPAYSSLFYHMSAVAAESARILSGGQASTAQLHQGAMEEAQKWANVNMTPKSFDAVAEAMKGEGQNRIQTYEQAIKGQRVGGKKDDAPAPASQGPTITGPNGEKMTLSPDGKSWVPVQ